jgi:hypothetical protein
MKEAKKRRRSRRTGSRIAMEGHGHHWEKETARDFSFLLFSAR